MSEQTAIIFWTIIALLISIPIIVVIHRIAGGLQTEKRRHDYNTEDRKKLRMIQKILVSLGIARIKK